MSADPLDTLVESLLYEGYALYPYTPAATKNATPTPFGIVYPPVYAARSGSTFDHLELRCLLRGGPHAPVRAEVRFLAADGPRHQAVARRVEREGPGERAFAFPPLAGRLAVSVAPEPDGLSLVVARVENHTPIGAEVGERAQALRHALISTHVTVRAPGHTFVSPLDAGGRAESVNTYPVLATDADDAVLGAAIVLPDHPRIAPETVGDMFDATEIEEALVLHVQALSDAERASIAEQDPKVRAMIERVERTAPEELLRLHGRLEMRDLTGDARSHLPSPGEPAEPGAVA